jgi:hypothetical protein
LKNAKSELQRLTRLLRKGKDSNTSFDGYTRINFKNNIHWSAIEEALLIEMIKKQHDCKSGIIRNAIHERAMRILGEERYSKIVENPTKFFEGIGKHKN